ncbi:hypothetical protein SAMD00019534_100110 [Acytostelium subglobosum LB1]|uniref:hypothetical protein n=1 Tax=Acytostelium subglobosum LB1 TaxID=1410327 RepID=UPI000645099C|nr:hypothetical protein SAMD00019534_100110 [Acytostelium subglobosum LB1]GAM26836.1 hypothetical protein SAMD00019534_100110 [Acytostelium subglobosum LB1]|eukprot:XP_012750104.1 hypothetical protein SAMD00019534_100110 [Acytostelium subglobosum LB1]
MGCCCCKQKKEEDDQLDDIELEPNRMAKQQVHRIDRHNETWNLYNGGTNAKKLQLVDLYNDDPNDPRTLTDYGILLSCEGRDKEALECLMKAVQLNPECSRSWIAYAEFYEQRNDMKRAMEVYKEGYKHASPKIALDIDDSDLILHLAIMSQKNKEYERAEKMFKKVITSGPTNVRGLGMYGRFIIQVHKNWDSANEYLKQAADIDPPNTYWCNFYGQFLKKWNKKEEANQYFKRAALAVDTVVPIEDPRIIIN